MVHTNDKFSILAVANSRLDDVNDSISKSLSQLNRSTDNEINRPPQRHRETLTNSPSKTRTFSISKRQRIEASVHFVSPVSGTLGLALAGSQAPAQPGTFSHPFICRGETGFYDLLFSVVLNKAKPLAGALGELNVGSCSSFVQSTVGMSFSFHKRN